MDMVEALRSLKASLGYDGYDGPELGPRYTGGTTPHEGDSYPSIISLLQSTGKGLPAVDGADNPDVIDSRDDMQAGGFGGYGPEDDSWRMTDSPAVEVRTTDVGVEHRPVDQHRYIESWDGRQRAPWGTVSSVMSPAKVGVSRKILALIGERKKRYKNWNGVGSDTGGIDDGPE